MNSSRSPFSSRLILGVLVVVLVSVAWLVIRAYRTPPTASPNAAPGVQRKSRLLSGIVLLHGTPPPEKPIDLSAACRRLNPNPVTTRHFVVNSNRGLANVVVYVRDLPESLRRNLVNASQPPSESPLLDQVGCIYEPYVIAVRTGLPFRIRNSDPELHNVHMSPRINQGRNFAQPTQGHATTHILESPELFVGIKCDVHPWEFAYVSAFDHPFFAVTDARGEFTLPDGLPAGKYTLAAVHLKLGETSQACTHQPGENEPLTFQFSMPDIPGARIPAPSWVTNRAP